MEFTKEEIDRFEARIKRLDSGCWEWSGGKFESGYGMFYLKRGSKKTFLAHRASWMIHNKMQVPNNLLVCHTCDNRPCVNPAHLYVGTYYENNRDTVKRKRGNRRYGTECSWSKVTEAQVMEILTHKYGRGANAELARKLGIHQSQVSHIRRGYRWPHIKQSLQTVDVKTR